MIYSKLEGTTSKQFKLGKNGIQFQLKTDDPNVLEIATPNGGIFTIGLTDIYDDDGIFNPDRGNAIPTALQIKSYVEKEVQNLIGEDIDAALDSLSELAAAIGNDPLFFSNLVNVLGEDYIDNGTLTMPTDIPDASNDGSGLPGKNGNLQNATISARLSILESMKSGDRLENLGSINNTINYYSGSNTSEDREDQIMYIYKKETGLSGISYVQKKISLKELRKLRPGVYTGAAGRDLEGEDYVFTEIPE
jgi:hypothetical protein